MLPIAPYYDSLRGALIQDKHWKKFGMNEILGRTIQYRGTLAAI
jgi:hypothetical protein